MPSKRWLLRLNDIYHLWNVSFRGWLVKFTFNMACLGVILDSSIILKRSTSYVLFHIINLSNFKWFCEEASLMCFSIKWEKWLFGLFKITLKRTLLFWNDNWLIFLGNKLHYQKKKFKEGGDEELSSPIFDCTTAMSDTQ